MKIKNFQTDFIKNIFNILLLILTLVFLKNIFLFIFEILNSSQYFEPAENENLVLAYFLSMNNKINFSELLKNGIFPPYPDFLHRIISQIDSNFLFYGRLLSIISFFSIIILVSFYSLYVNKNLTFLLLISLLLFGNEDHILYFLIFRPDSLFLLLGLFSISLSLISKNKNNVDKFLIFFSAIFCFLSCITKQTGIVFIILNLIIIFFEDELIKNFKRILLKVIIFILSIILSYFFYKNYINNDIDLYFFSGYKLYSQINLDHFKKSLIIFLVKGYAFIFFTAFYLVFFTSKLQNNKHLILKFILILVSLVTIRLFFNLGAINNNYILINITSLMIIIFLFNELNKKKKLILLIFLLFVFFNYHYKIKFFNIYNLNFKQHDITHSEIYELINYKKKILTDRLDNYLVLSNKNIFYESSVITPIYSKTTPASMLNNNLQEHLENLNLNIKNNIINGEFDFILLGISKNNFIKIFPEINDHYKIIKKEKIKQGNFEFTAELYAPLKK
jgi:hypothetical protein